jgi:SAM-dependent methyltransferase
VSDLYSTYSTFKGWGGSIKDDAQPEDFRYYLTAASCRPNCQILELGFGAGQFLDWARASGYQVAGCEILPEMIVAARERGHLIFDDFYGEINLRFDVIVALDVLEHIPDLARMISRCSHLLKDGGRLIARFPNGDSPFSGRYQNGDATHLKPMSATALAQIAEPAGMRIERAMNPRPLPSALVPKLKRKLIYAGRDLIEIILGRLYYSCRVPMDPNIFVVMGKAAPLFRAPLQEVPKFIDGSIVKNIPVHRCGLARATLP